MPERDAKSRPPDSMPAVPNILPAGAPTWVTSELIEHTLRVWQPFYADPLIPEDALEIILGVGRMLDVLSCAETAGDRARRKSHRAAERKSGRR